MPDLASNGNHSPDRNTKQELDKIIVSVEHDGAKNHSDEPPLKKRKLADGGDSYKSSPRPASPPWRKFVAEGPTSFVENGRRKSGRTNLIPLESTPPSARRQTRARRENVSEKQPKPLQKSKGKPKDEVREDPKPVTIEKVKRGPGRPRKIRTEEPTQTAPIVVNGKSPRGNSRNLRRHLPTAHNDGIGKDGLNTKEQDGKPGTSATSPPVTLQKVKFRVALPKPSVMTPANIAPPRRFATFEEFLDQDRQEPFSGQETLTEEQIHNEALARHKVSEAQRLGHLSGDSAAKMFVDSQTEPPRQYAHYDHLLRHVTHFRLLLRQERKDHRKKAEQIAYEAKRYVEEKRKRGRVKTAEELAKEEYDRNKARYRSVAKDVDRLWLAVEGEIGAIRRRQYEEEQQARIKGHLNRVLDRTDQMLQRKEDSEVDSDIDGSIDAHSEGDSSGSDSEDLSDSSSGSEIDIEPEDPDVKLTAEELQAKYQSLPQIEDDESAHSGVALSVEDDSDPETEMDSEFDSEDSDDSDDGGSGGNEDGSDEDQDAETGLLSLFFSKKDIAEFNDQDVPKLEAASLSNQTKSDGQTLKQDVPTSLIEELPTEMDLDSAGGTLSTDPAPLSNADEISNIPLRSSIETPRLTPTAKDEIEDGASQEHSTHTSPQTSISKRTEPESASSIEPRAESRLPETPPLDKSNVKTPISPLLRGTLREYQHEGLDWLANLYATGRSGILADEMGLGKTIQSISLLAHLATQYEVWGPHLIVVPTSVMLNWEMEFKKFLPGFKILTYYGNQEERKQKRRGWMADDSFNVCITSYQLVIQDANSFKRRKWHYMILDEAHNIKNFRSERWQTMMTFNTRARLLLTGTPLQNNLTELWSLLFFLHYGQEGEGNDDAFAGLKEWSEWFKRPVESILEHGRQVLDAEDKEQVAKLHKVIRPFLLRRLKADVEKQMPLKYEHVEMCRLSKRQRQLYDGFMSRAQTKETLASGNYLSIINALMQLRKVCNHPDLFETRPINTSFAMSRSVVANFEIQDLLVRRRMFATDVLNEIDLDFLQLVPISNEKISSIENLETLRRHAYAPLKALRDSQAQRLRRNAIASSHSRREILVSLDNIGRKSRLDDLDRTVYYEAYRHHQRPIYGRGLLQKLELGTVSQQLSKAPLSARRDATWDRQPPTFLSHMVQSVATRSEGMEPYVQKYACITPAVVATDLATTLITEVNVETIHRELAQRPDPFHQARMKLSIAFPDKRLLQYDCGKLQRLDKLLRRLQAGGHRALIFTQMTKVLDILEQFLNIHGHRYLRLDGATKIEQRQILTDRFNNDPRILAFILSSRSGGLGINLTGADTVIFYDLDWNPAMDRQCTDRAHRIGQTRDVHIYRFVSEHTIESNILRKANQKQLLDDVVIQEGEFTTDYKNKVSYRDMLDETTDDDVAGAAMDRVLGNDKSAVAAFEQAEDKEDVSAAKVAAKEIQHADDGDFEEKAIAVPGGDEAQSPGPYGANSSAVAEANDGVHHIDDYLLRMESYLLKDVPLAPLRDRSKRGRRQGDEHRRRRHR